MADLDDFFAKKDRKKGKSSKKFATTEEVAKKLEDTVKKTEKQKKERVQEGDENSSQAIDQDEWKEFEEEKKDYTGLKIGNLTINADQENNLNNQDAGSGDQQDGADSNQDCEKKPGPWKRIDVQTDAVIEEPPKPVEKKPETPSTNLQAYKPPSLRYSTSQPSTNYPRTKASRFGSTAPDIHNEEYFPTLSKSNESKKNKSEGSFEVVQSNRASSQRQQLEQSKTAGGPKLSLGNRYTTLSNDS
ncbi:protein CDV3 homolog [Sitophilus oryzae]|uniref:Protein CDV3 homolog n=1 Tax=Sitophilus oryzae TaxID=7048 RepID=A0A6J2XIB4_SITOR|nr:protein CDV3 homolog [Sitophilus oryzae]